MDIKAAINEMSYEEIVRASFMLAKMNENGWGNPYKSDRVNKFWHELASLFIQEEDERIAANFIDGGDIE